MSEASEKQKDFMTSIANLLGIKCDIENMTKEEASEFIKNNYDDWKKELEYREVMDCFIDN